MLAFAACGGGSTRHHEPTHDGGKSSAPDAGHASQMTIPDAAMTPPDAFTASDAATDTGDDAGAGMRPAIPPPHSLCAELGLVRTAMMPNMMCPPLLCQCAPAPAPQTFYGFMPVNGGCTVEIDCNVACMMDSYDVSQCVMYYQPCNVSADCGGLHCARPSAGEIGECSQGGSCFHDDDCEAPGRCVAYQADGRRRCATGDEAEFCNQPDQCQTGLRCVLPSHDFVGRCSAGEDGAECFAGEDCKSPARCIVANAAISGFCSLAKVGDHCAQQSDCDSGMCALSSLAWLCTDGALGSPCGHPSDCQSGFCLSVRGSCGDGALGSPCEQDVNCKSNKCVPNVGCTAGMIGDACMTDAQCETSRCAHGAKSGVCVTGELDAMCVDDGDCISGRCGLIGGSDMGRCADGKVGSWCGMDDDCDTGFCTANGAPEGGMCVADPG